MFFGTENPGIHTSLSTGITVPENSGIPRIPVFFCSVFVYHLACYVQGYIESIIFVNSVLFGLVNDCDHILLE